MTRERNCINCKFSYEEECLDAPCYVYKCLLGEENCITKFYNSLNIQEVE